MTGSIGCGGGNGRDGGGGSEAFGGGEGSLLEEDKMLPRDIGLFVRSVFCHLLVSKVAECLNERLKLTPDEIGRVSL